MLHPLLPTLHNQEAIEITKHPNNFNGEDGYRLIKPGFTSSPANHPPNYLYP
jgi:hypothetical protein